jgi:hypothetical protein
MPQLNASEPIVYEDGTMQPVFQRQMNRFEYAMPLAGTGSPEGVVEGLYLQLYIDIFGAPGSIEYRKMLPDIGGDKTLGWVLL